MLTAEHAEVCAEDAEINIDLLSSANSA